MNASPKPKKERPKFSIAPTEQRRINDEHWQAGRVCVVLQPPGKPYKLVLAEKLPRANAGKPPRRGVHIPELPIMSMRQQRVSKHAKQQQRHGCFSKTGFDTIERKQAFLVETAETANLLAHQRQLDRQAHKGGQPEAVS